MTEFSDDELAKIKQIVSDTVAETLLKMGINTQDPIALQADFQHLRAWRESIGTVKRQSLTTAIGLITAGFLGLIWMSIKGH